MAKRRRRRRLGSVIQVRRVSGLGSLKNPNSAIGAGLPVIIGGGVAAATTLGIRQFMKPTTDTQIMIYDNAPWFGAGAGILSSLALWNLASQSAGIGALVSALTVGIGLVAIEAGAKMKAEAAATAGFGAIVPEYSRAVAGLGGRRRMGAVVMEPSASRGYGAPPGLGWTPYGEEVNLGAINVDAFGTPMFRG